MYKYKCLYTYITITCLQIHIFFYSVFFHVIYNFSKHVFMHYSNTFFFPLKRTVRAFLGAGGKDYQGFVEKRESHEVPC